MGVHQLRLLDTASRPGEWKTGCKEGTTGEERETPGWRKAFPKALKRGLQGRYGSVHPAPSVSIPPKSPVRNERWGLPWWRSG